ncbi:cache domain-containing protein [Sulfurimonas sp.]|uniref:cache domain-containing protein n=1 Tax=Sulfurimonas sp. TaxID=2022749 RepID=UPI002618605E|nr:cache domain-containing protein [Sulfurimonas sp.]
MNLFEKLVGKIDKIVLTFTVVVLFASLYFVYTLKESYSQKETLQSLDNALFLTRNLLEEEQQHALSLSLLLAQDKTFLEAFYSNKRKKAFEIIEQKIKSLQKLQGYNFEVQVHDKNLHTYLRSWDYSIKNVPLASFRKGLVFVKKHKKPLVSIEVGKRLNIKAISPILKNGSFEGSIEVIENFEHLRKALAEHGYALFILLNKKYLNIATRVQDNPLIFNKFVLVNKSYDRHSFESLKKSNLHNLESSGYFTQDKYAFTYFSIKNFQNQNLGYFVIVFENSAPLMLKTHDEITTEEANSSGVVIQ